MKHIPGQCSNLGLIQGSDRCEIRLSEKGHYDHQSAIVKGSNAEANAARLALAWNCHQDLIDALTEALACLTADSDSEEQYATEIAQARAALSKVGGVK
jgi:hypothetical protein